ncbi:MAG: ankyrin repeat domain-containing protein [Elusimicrobiaceae bacterium]|nr:ankyrin repeat domain-containing protein [Elusimicrobiaceae bacterium]
MLIAAGAKPVPKTMLILASKFGQTKEVKDLISKGVKANIASGINHATPLMYASNAPIARILLSAGANVNAKDDFGNTALLAACDKDKNGVIKVLLAAGANVNAKDSNGNTPLLEACFWGKKDAVKVLLAAGADVNVKDKYGETPIFHTHKPEIMRVLIKAGANVNVKDSNGGTPLLEACFLGEKEAIKVLLVAGADINAKDNHGKGPIQIAKEWIGEKEPRTEIITLLQSVRAIKKPKQKRKKK